MKVVVKQLAVSEPRYSRRVLGSTVWGCAEGALNTVEIRVLGVGATYVQL